MEKKIINSSMDDSHNQMLEMMKRQRPSGDTKITYITMQSMYQTLQVIDKYNPALEKIIEHMVQTTLGT